jgi:hypothetical protein
VAVLRGIDVRNRLIPISTEFQNHSPTDRPTLTLARIRAADLEEAHDYLSS